jgi:hypothetical protein
MVLSAQCYPLRVLDGGDVVTLLVHGYTGLQEMVTVHGDLGLLKELAKKSLRPEQKVGVMELRRDGSRNSLLR